MLDTFHWQPEEYCFLGLTESGILDINEIRDLTWSRFRISYDGLVIMDRPITLREDLQKQIMEMLQSETGLYGESISGKGIINKVFSKDTLKNITREIDQFKD
ncbi:MAG: hypothetical protein B6241_12645 [Spirochaetaceae bacterium 4572_59]|nr:MAG: hypothetical protein B6241_12645 [Spirochaetaceae bacterium 4572_59]